MLSGVTPRIAGCFSPNSHRCIQIRVFINMDVRISRATVCAIARAPKAITERAIDRRRLERLNRIIQVSNCDTLRGKLAHVMRKDELYTVDCWDREKRKSFLPFAHTMRTLVRVMILEALRAIYGAVYCAYTLSRIVMGATALGNQRGPAFAEDGLMATAPRGTGRTVNGRERRETRKDRKNEARVGFSRRQNASASAREELSRIVIL